MSVCPHYDGSQAGDVLLFLFRLSVAKVCLLVGKKEVKGHIECVVTLLPSSCYQRSGPLQKSHQYHCQDANRALLSINPSVTSSFL